MAPLGLLGHPAASTRAAGRDSKGCRETVIPRLDGACPGWPVSLRIIDRSMRIACHAGPSAKARARGWAEYLRLWVPRAVVLAVLLGCLLQTWAHSDLAPTLSSADASQHACQVPHPRLPATQHSSPAPPGVPLTVILFLLTVIAMAQGAWRWRRTTALGLVLVLGIFTFGIAVHSVHHLLEPGKSAECLVFSASQHVSGTLAEPCDVHAPGLAVPTATHEDPDVPASILRNRSDLPRAPPPLLS
jgi:hypothetical protein